VFILGIFSAAIIGFVLNIYANMYYVMFVTGEQKLGDFSTSGILFPTFAFIVTCAFLQFLIYDYRHEMDFSHSFFGRFFDYFENVFWFGRVTKSVNKITVFIFKWFFAIAIAVYFYNVSAFFVLGTWLFLIACWILGRFIYKQRYKKRH